MKKIKSPSSSKKNPYEHSPFKGPDEYVDFVRKHKKDRIFGDEAVNLARKMQIPEPEIRPIKRLTNNPKVPYQKNVVGDF